MALTDLTYDALQSAIADWMARDDLTVAQNKDAILLFEAEANRRLRTSNQETSANLTTSSGAATLPTDFLAWRSLTWAGSNTIEIDYVHPTIFRGTFTSDAVGTPSWFTIEDSTINIRPVDDTTDIYTLRYWQKLANLSDAAPTNWLLTYHPDLYLAGSLYNAYKFVRDADAAGAYKQIMEEQFNQLEQQAFRTLAPAELRVTGVVA